MVEHNKASIHLIAGTVVADVMSMGVTPYVIIGLKYRNLMLAIEMIGRNITCDACTYNCYVHKCQLVILV